MTIRVYLSGHIARQGESSWRSEFIAEYTKIGGNQLDVEWLSPTEFTALDPKEPSVARLNKVRDHYLMSICDVTVMNIDLNVGKALGASFELGNLHAYGIPVIMINKSRDISSTKFLEENASVAFDNYTDAAKFLKAML